MMEKTVVVPGAARSGTTMAGCSPRQVHAANAGPARGIGAERKRPAGGDAGSGGALPSFYGIGAQKAGTTWLYEMLKGHPQIYLPKRKEIHYWDHNDARQLSLQWYRDHFTPGRINGDITPAYAVLDEAKIEAIHALTPQARLLFSMRHPVERAWSFVQMAVGRNFTDLPPDLMAGEPQGEVLEFVRRKLFQRGCLERSNYAGTIRRWRRRFGDAALMCYRYERIARDPRRLLAEVCAHIGADPAWVDGLPPDVIGRMVFSSDKIPFPRALRAEFAERCAPYLDDLEQLLGERFDDWRS